MQQKTKAQALLLVGGILTMTLVGAVIGIPMVLLGAGMLANAHEDEHGDRPWWAKSVFTLARERLRG